MSVVHVKAGDEDDEGDSSLSVAVAIHRVVVPDLPATATGRKAETVACFRVVERAKETNHMIVTRRNTIREERDGIPTMATIEARVFRTVKVRVKTSRAQKIL